MCFVLVATTVILLLLIEAYVNHRRHQRRRAANSMHRSSEVSPLEHVDHSFPGRVSWGNE